MLQTFDRIGPFIVVLSQSEAIPARKRRVVVRCVVCERVSEMNERSLLDKRTEEQRACAKCRVYTTNGTWTKGWKAKMENAAIEANRLNKENADLRDEIDKVLRERDLALGRLENEIKAANQARMAEERARESLDELDAAIYECLPSDYDDDSPLDCVEHAADRLRDLAQERDEHKAKREEYAAEARSLRERLKDAYRERDEARAEVEHWRVKAEAYGGMVDGCGPALEAAGHPIDPFQPDGRVGGIARSVAALIKERDEARAEVDALRSQIERLRGALHIVSLDEYESTSSASEKVHAHARQARIVLNETLAGVTPSDAAHVASLENLFLKACKRAEKWETASKDAYRRGAEAMREACIGYAHKIGFHGLTVDIRALPVPEET